MPFLPHWRMSMLGRLGTSGERFSYSLNLGNGNGTALTTTNSGVEGSTFFADCASDAANFHASSEAKINAAAILETVKFAFIGADGKYTRDPIIVDVPDVPGAIASEIHPAQTALVVSLNTARRGSSGRGRFYLPMPAVPVSATDLLISSANRDSVQGAAATFVNNINNQPGFDVADIVVVVASTKGVNSKVTGIRVGRVLDTVRSRRTSLPEAYAPVTPVS